MRLCYSIVYNKLHVKCESMINTKYTNTKHWSMIPIYCESTTEYWWQDQWYSLFGVTSSSETMLTYCQLDPQLLNAPNQGTEWVIHWKFIWKWNRYIVCPVRARTFAKMAAECGKTKIVKGCRRPYLKYNLKQMDWETVWKVSTCWEIAACI